MCGGRERGAFTVLSHRLPEWWTNAENDAGEDVLEAGDEEEDGVFGVLDVGFLFLNFGWDEPRLPADGLEGSSLDEDAYDDLAQ